MQLPINDLNLTPMQLMVQNMYPTYPKFMSANGPKQLSIQYPDIKTIRRSVSQPRVSINDISILYSDDKLKAGIDFCDKWLEFLNRLSNIAKPLTETLAVAVIIFNDYRHFYLSDFKVIFEQIMRSEYGSFYASVDAQRILTAFYKYNECRQVEKNIITKQIVALGDKYINPIVEEAYKTIDDSLAGKFPDPDQYRAERNRLFYIQLPRLQKLRDEYEDQQMKLIT